MAKSSKKLTWLKTFLGELGKEQVDYSLFCENERVVKLTKNHVYHGRMRHIGMRYHFFRQLISDGTVKLENVKGVKNPSNILPSQ